MFMKTLAINSSPLKERGNTYVIQSSFVSGLREAGVDVEEIFLNDLNIKPCIGKLNCWVKTPGKCCQKDDMDGLLEKLKRSELWVLASPVYWDGVTGVMKNMLDRLLPLIVPEISIINGHCRHALQPNVLGGKIVLISTCGFWELDNFDPLVSHVKAVAKNIHREFVGALLRPHGALIKYWAKDNEKVRLVLEASFRAGVELKRNGWIPNDLLTKVSSELLNLNEYEKAINDNFNRIKEKK